MQRFRDGYRVWWREGGRRRSRFFKIKREAERFELERKLGIAGSETMASQNPTFAEFAARWVQEYSKPTKSGNSHDEDKRTIERHLRPAFGPKRLRSLKKPDLVELKARLLSTTAYQKKKPLAPKTVNNILMVAKKIMADALDLGIVPENPWRGIKRCRVPDKEFDYWMPDERERFFELADNPDIRDAAYLACHTGLRRGELAALTWRAIDFERRRLRVSQSYSVRLKEYGPTKGKEVAEVPLNDAALELLHRRAEERRGTSVFPVHIFGNLRRDFGALCKRTGVRPIRFHDTRHTFASNLAMAGVDLMVIQKLMRHKTYQMTLRYAHLHPTHLEGATDALVSAHKPAHKRSKNSGKSRKYLKLKRTLSDSNARPSGSKPVAVGL